MGLTDDGAGPGAGGDSRPGRNPRPVRGSRPVRALLVAVGVVSLGLALIGIVVPVLPTTPFLLLAAAAFARSSERLHRWLLGQRTLGPIITQWQDTGSMTAATRRRAILVVAVTFAVSIVLVGDLVARLGLAATGSIVATFLLRIPTRG